ncbi:hypothetical protein GCK72_002850 [Caenorhabditis remanei]|uniref:F-box domain-containing protein n=1 Tax=Caenorhabditis remanei TaxID=31234 RepID=A0A6A5HW12_CAERE|nr:hypothetical protein GCK72_002850 [Caenorhabditis remanei]KAF1771026.1 hypothetical protein GCK72_002850 [Caenorhabditis remanei]
MTKKSIELSELPPEIQQLLVDKCDFITRRRLRASSSLMYQFVNSTKLFIPFVKIKELSNEGVLVKLTIKLFKDDYTLKFKKNQTGGTRICQGFRKEVLTENSNPMDEAVDWFRQMCLQKNVTIGHFQIDTNGDPKKLTEKLDGVLGKSETPLKIKSIHCVGTESVDLMWKVMEYCDKRLLKEMKVETSNKDEVFEFFGKQDEIVKNLEKIEINCLCDVSDEDVLSLNASVISLKSENFTDDLVYKLIEKFTNRREDGSAFRIENSHKRNLDLEMIPPGFEETNSTNEYKEYRHQLINTNHPIVYIRVSEDRVRLQIGDTKKANFWNEDGRMYISAPEYDYDSSEYDAYDDFDDLESEYYGNPYASDPDYDLLDDRAFDESDFENDEDEY